MALAGEGRCARLPGRAYRRPGRLGILPRLPARIRGGMGRRHHPRSHACVLAHHLRCGDRGTPRHNLRRRGGPAPGPAPLSRGMAARCCNRHPIGSFAGGRRAGTGPRLRQDRLVRQLVGRTRHRDHLLGPGNRHGLCHGGAPLRGPLGAPRAAGNRHRAGTGGPDPWCRAGSHFRSHHPALHTPVAGLWRHPYDGTCARRVRSRGHRVGCHCGQDPDDDPVHRRQL